MGRSRLTTWLAALVLTLLPCTGAKGEEAAGTSPHLLVPVYFYRGYTVGRGQRSSGLQASADGGKTWACRTWPELITNSVSVDASGRYVYLACGNGVMVSRDAAQSWRLTGGWQMTEVQKVAIDRRDPRSAWAATAYGIFRTDDAFAPGDVWRQADHDALFRFTTDVRQDVTDAKMLWVASDRGLFVSRDEGTTFQATSVDVPVRRIHVDPRRPERLVLATDGRGVLESLDGGTSFRRLKGSRDVAFTVAGDPDDPDLLYVGGREEVAVCRDGTCSYSPPGALPEHYYVYGLIRDPETRGRLVAAGSDGLFESPDGGTTWKRLGFEDALVCDLTAAPLAEVPQDGPSGAPGTLELPEHDVSLAACSPEADTAFEARREALLAHFREKPKPPVGKWIGWARALQEVEEGRADDGLWNSVLEQLASPQHSMFFSLPLAGFYLHARDRIPDEVALEIRRVLTEVPVYRGDTENHWVMHYAALLLAAQTWPETSASRWYAGRTTQELYDEAHGWLFHWARLAATKGQGEFDSPNYLFMYVMPMLFLHEFAEEPDVRQLAGMMLDLLLADYLTESLDGAYCGGHSRVIDAEVQKTRANKVSVLHALYAGGIPLPKSFSSWALFCALSSYRPPALLERIANHRDEPFVHTEVKRVRNVIRFDERLNPPVYKTDYATPVYIMGSLQGGILQPIQQHTWDVTWRSAHENSTLFTVHPAVSARELAMFFPEEIQGLTRTITAQKGSYADPDKLVSSSAYERVFQHENVLLALYQVPPGAKHQHVDLYVPDCLAWSEESGWMFGRDGDFAVAVYPLRKGTWITDTGFRRYRCPADRAGFVVVAPPEGPAPSFDAFRRRVLESPQPRLEGDGAHLDLLWKESENRAYALHWDEASGWIDAKPAPFPADWLYRGPFLRSKVGSARIELTDGETTRTLDFNDLTITEAR